MSDDFEIGDSVELVTPYKGYRYGEIIDFDVRRIVVELTSGKIITVWADEIKKVR
jgi:hypothetical protein